MKFEDKPKSQVGVGDGDRTRDIRCHRPTLYQLSYAHQWFNRGQFTLKPASIEMDGNLGGARQPGVELRTRSFRPAI